MEREQVCCLLAPLLYEKLALQRKLKKQNRQTMNDELRKVRIKHQCSDTFTFLYLATELKPLAVADHDSALASASDHHILQPPGARNNEPLCSAFVTLFIHLRAQSTAAISVSISHSGLQRVYLSRSFIASRRI